MTVKRRNYLLGFCESLPFIGSCVILFGLLCAVAFKSDLLGILNDAFDPYYYI